MFLAGVVIGLVVGAALTALVAVYEVRRQTRRIRVAERRARNAERLAEIGAMTGGLAHEIKNPLSTIGLNAQLLGEAVEELPIDAVERGRLVRRTDVLRREAERLRDTLADFLRFAGDIRLEPVEADVNRAIEELVDFYLPQAEHQSIRLRTELKAGAMPAQLDVGHFKQGILNLLINATQAMDEPDKGGASGQGNGRPRELILRTEEGMGEDGPEWVVHVIDTGPGIPPERMGQIFTPYFTTKSGGSGLGLPTTKRLIEAHGGRIEVHSAPGRGCDFSVHLPRIGPGSPGAGGEGAGGRGGA